MIWYALRHQTASERCASENQKKICKKNTLYPSLQTAETAEDVDEANHFLLASKLENMQHMCLFIKFFNKIYEHMFTIL